MYLAKQLKSLANFLMKKLPFKLEIGKWQKLWQYLLSLSVSLIMVNQVLVSATRWQPGSQKCFATFIY
jgi:hypothetical protein